MRIKLLGKPPDELKAIALGVGLPAFTGKQIAQWLYVKRVRSIDEMTNISKAGREKLSERYEVGAGAPVGKAVSSDGTKKYLFPVSCVRVSSLNAYEEARPEELEQAAEDGKRVLLRISRELTNETQILPLYRVVKNVVAPGSATPVDRYTFGFATDKTTVKLLISVNGLNWTAEPLYVKTLSASDLNAVGTAEKGVANGVCPLGADGKIPASYIPSAEEVSY
mgnify:CR=1 FL=1